VDLNTSNRLDGWNISLFDGSPGIFIRTATQTYRNECDPEWHEKAN